MFDIIHEINTFTDECIAIAKEVPDKLDYAKAETIAGNPFKCTEQVESVFNAGIESLKKKAGSYGMFSIFIDTLIRECEFRFTETAYESQCEARRRMNSARSAFIESGRAAELFACWKPDPAWRLDWND